MRHTLLGSIVAVLVLALAVFSQVQPSSRPMPLTFNERYKNSIEAAIDNAGGWPRAMTNVRKIEEEVIAALKEATPQSIQKPTMIACKYYPAMQNGMGMFITWIEDHPSLREVTVRNPETKEQITIKIPEQRLNEAIKDGEERLGFIHYWFFRLPVGFVKGNSQILEVSAPQQKIPANCYPSIFVDEDTTVATTQPATQPSEK